MSRSKQPTSPVSPGEPASVAAASQAEVKAFLDAARAVAPTRAAGQRGRLAFAMDATFSRQPTWDLACGIQGELFAAAADLGGLDVQLIYYRGQDECRASSWVSDPKRLGQLMASISCQGGQTQISRVLTHLAAEAERTGLKAAVFVGDAVEENADALAAKAGELAVLGVRLFLFQEGEDRHVERVFRELARLTSGAWCRFRPGADAELRALLRAVAAYAAGGRQALLDRPEPGALRLLSAMGK
ncbi:VWA domain-containing protein [Xanthobacter sp. DSM 24535]|uniref:VWA domain-containing protein n=1 Tax=Roseixanthobacter psychrophilus TaxID=3119917 RepID=UPI003728B339